MSTTRKAPAKRRGTHIVDDDVLIWTAKSGAEIRIDLDIPASVLDGALADKPEDDPDDETQFTAVLGWIGQDAVDAFDQMGILERTRFTAAFFTEFTKALGLARGEFVSSLPSAGSTDPNSDSTSDASSTSPSTTSA